MLEGLHGTLISLEVEFGSLGLDAAVSWICLSDVFIEVLLFTDAATCMGSGPRATWVLLELHRWASYFCRSSLFRSLQSAAVMIHAFRCLSYLCDAVLVMWCSQPRPALAGQHSTL